MAPNTVETSFSPDPERVSRENKNQNLPGQEVNYNLYIFQSTLNLLANILIGTVVGISLLFALRNGLPLGATSLHIVLCVIGVSYFLIFLDLWYNIYTIKP